MVVEGHLLDQGLPFRAQGKLRCEVLVLPVGVQARPAEEAVEIVKADVVRLRFLVLAAVPLADGLGEVAGLAQETRHGGLIAQAARFAGKAGAQLTVPHGQASGEQRAARGRTRWLRVGRQEMQAFASQAVHVGRGRAGQQAAAVDAEVAIAHVVHEEDQDVRLFPGLLLQLGQLLLGRGRLVVVRDHRLHVRGDLHRVGGQRVGAFAALQTRQQRGCHLPRQGRRRAPGSRFGRYWRWSGHAAQPGERRSGAHPFEKVAS